MKNLLIITQKVDESDDLLGFFVDWVKEFSKRFDKVFVITLAKGEYKLPANVFIYSLGKEKKSNKLFRVIKFYLYSLKLIPQSKGVFCHMSPIFAVATWPIVSVFGKKIILWYLHRSVTLRLKLAEKLCYKIVTAAKESLNLKSKKIVEAGHGINLEKFRTERIWPEKKENFRILSVGRISRIKDYETLIKAAAILRDNGLKFKFKIIGRPVMPYDFDYFEQLKKMVTDLKLEDFVEFIGFIPYSQIANYYKESDIFINFAPSGGIDKVVLEAMASGSLVLVSNDAFKKYLGGYDLFFKHGEAGDLAEKIIKLGKMSIQEIERVSSFLVQSVSGHHNLTNTVNAISYLFNQ